ncbi:hypothetical protein BsWGS_19056 [Bradybaena similaris]
MATVRIFIAVAAMICCCVIVYPRFIHPLVLQMLGMSETQKTDVDDNGLPPHYRNQHPERNKPPEDPRKNMRASPHPGMRAAAEMQKQPQQGSGRGMMGVVLPMYAIGIILYLVYTLFKVFNKSKKNSWNRQGAQIDGRSEGDNSVDRMGFPLTLDSGGDVRNFLHDQQQKQQLEDLLSRIDNKNASLSEMKLLQKRLEETEAQMSRILEAMQMVQTNVDKMEVPEPQEELQAQSSDLSPDIESYELINRQGEVVEAKDEEERHTNEINETEGQTDFQKHEAGESNAEFVKLNSQAGRLPKEVDFDDIDKDSDDEIEDVSDLKEAGGDNAHGSDENSKDDVKDLIECAESGVRLRKKQT